MTPKQARQPGFMDLREMGGRARGELARPATLMRTTEWGLLTAASLLTTFLFPPYFVTVMTVAFLNAGGLLWVTHLSEKGRQKLKEFEREFRQGYQMEERGEAAAAVAFYRSLAPRYQDYPSIAQIALRRAEHLEAAAAKAPRGRGRKARRPGRRTVKP